MEEQEGQSDRERERILVVCVGQACLFVVAVVEAFAAAVTARAQPRGPAAVIGSASSRRASAANRAKEALWRRAGAAAERDAGTIIYWDRSRRNKLTSMPARQTEEPCAALSWARRAAYARGNPSSARFGTRARPGVRLCPTLMSAGLMRPALMSSH
jgi:hypothetical protein